LAYPVYAQTGQATPAGPPGTVPSAQLPAANEPPPSKEEMGDAYGARQRYQAAIEAYKAIAHPSATVWNKMGIAYQMLFDTADAVRCYKQSIKLDAKNASVVNNLATVYDSMKQYGQAEKMYRKALKIDSKSAIIYKNLGTNLMMQKKYVSGGEAYRQALAIDPGVFQDTNSPRVSNPSNVQDRGALNYYMALGCVRAGQTDCALKSLRMALNEGFITAKKVAADPAFQSLRDNPEFQQLLTSQQEPAKK
jgi:tetratricopeptide (TPR) repeat protein